MHILPTLPIAIPLPSSGGLGSSKPKISTSSSRPYTGNGPLSIVTGRASDSPANSLTMTSNPNVKAQSKLHKPQQQQQQQQQYRYSPQPLSQHQHQYEQNKLTKRMQHLSYPMANTTSVSTSLPQTSDRYRYHTRTHWRPERSSSYGITTSPEHDALGSGENYQLYSSSSYQHAPQSKKQPQNTFSQNLRHSLQHGYHHSSAQHQHQHHHRTPSQSQSQNQYQGQQQQQHQHQYQNSPRHSSSHYDQIPTASRKPNPHHSHLHSTQQYHTGNHHATGSSTVFNSTLPMSMPVVSMLGSKDASYTKKQRQKKCVTFADPIAQYQELPSVCSMSAPTSSVLSSGSILKRGSLTRSMVADDYGASSGSNGGLLAYEQSKSSSSGGFRNSESRRSRSSSHPIRYGNADSFYALEDSLYLADYERNAYWDSQYDDGHVCNDASCSGYKYDSRFSLSTDYLPLNEQYPYC
ncbi:hypothetical protein H4R99_001566 [Coemansia sp. RSA 1722]|nr:hypothetical protein IWW45_005030 [Coemansia sp. RSA 485]KAJ2604793.1 hypothetical protein H4R99_001566 [Coemansia sp. RSA 1722]